MDDDGDALDLDHDNSAAVAICRILFDLPKAKRAGTLAVVVKIVADQRLGFLRARAVESARARIPRDQEAE